jgi:ribosomal protein L11 methyltransferase
MEDGQNTQADADGSWATLTIALRGGRIEAEELRTAQDHLQDLAALLAMEDGVSGVELREPKNASVERGELVVYTDPAHLEHLSATTDALAAALHLDITHRSEVRDDEDWKDAWKAHYRPLLFGDRQLLLRPSWIDRRPDDPDLEIVLDPGRAFGTGLHESTALCLDRLCALRGEDRSVERALDLGCGSGVLGIAALRLWGEGLQRVVAVDVDPEAVATTEENIEINDLTQRVDARTGTLDDLGDERFSLIIANIRPEVLIPIASALLEHAHPGAALVLSGILAEEGDEVAQAYREAGWISAGPPRERGEWVGLDWFAP